MTFEPGAGRERHMTAENYLCLNFGPDWGECWVCGGFTASGDGPFEADSRFCSLDCAADFQERFGPERDA